MILLKRTEREDSLDIVPYCCKDCAVCCAFIVSLYMFSISTVPEISHCWPAIFNHYCSPSGLQWLSIGTCSNCPEPLIISHTHTPACFYPSFWVHGIWESSRCYQVNCKNNSSLNILLMHTIKCNHRNVTNRIPLSSFFFSNRHYNQECCNDRHNSEEKHFIF